jgi:hypothetical protein
MVPEGHGLAYFFNPVVAAEQIEYRVHHLNKYNCIISFPEMNIKPKLLTLK